MLPVKLTFVDPNKKGKMTTFTMWRNELQEYLDFTEEKRDINTFLRTASDEDIEVIFEYADDECKAFDVEVTYDEIFEDTYKEYANTLEDEDRLDKDTFYEEEYECDESKYPKIDYEELLQYAKEKCATTDIDIRINVLKDGAFYVEVFDMLGYLFPIYDAKSKRYQSKEMFDEDFYIITNNSELEKWNGICSYCKEKCEEDYDDIKFKECCSNDGYRCIGLKYNGVETYVSTKEDIDAYFEQKHRKLEVAVDNEKNVIKIFEKQEFLDRFGYLVREHCNVEDTISLLVRVMNAIGLKVDIQKDLYVVVINNEVEEKTKRERWLLIENENNYIYEPEVFLSFLEAYEEMERRFHEFDDEDDGFNKIHDNSAIVQTDSNDLAWRIQCVKMDVLPNDNN